MVFITLISSIFAEEVAKIFAIGLISGIVRKEIFERKQEIFAQRTTDAAIAQLKNVIVLVKQLAKFINHKNSCRFEDVFGLMAIGDKNALAAKFAGYFKIVNSIANQN